MLIVLEIFYSLSLTYITCFCNLHGLFGIKFSNMNFVLILKTLIHHGGLQSEFFFYYEIRTCILNKSTYQNTIYTILIRRQIFFGHIKLCRCHHHHCLSVDKNGFRAIT